jgi:hypothetical protein
VDVSGNRVWADINGTPVDGDFSMPYSLGNNTFIFSMNGNSSSSEGAVTFYNLQLISD